MRRKLSDSSTIDFTAASERALGVRSLYQQLEENNHNSAWTIEEDMLAFSTDIGALGRLVMAAEGRWVYNGEVQPELRSKLAECLWWILVLSDRLGMDITEAFTSFIDRLDRDLTKSIAAASRNNCN